MEALTSTDEKSSELRENSPFAGVLSQDRRVRVLRTLAHARGTQGGMNRTQLAHVLRAACQIAADNEVLVVGSQAILGSHDEDELPAPATASMEADIAFLDDPDRRKADQVEGGIGEFSPIHELSMTLEN